MFYLSKFNATKFFIFSIFMLISTTSQASIPWFDSDKQPTLAPMLEQVTPAVVNIAAAGTKKTQQKIPDSLRFLFGPRGQRQQERPFQSVGSGVIINANKGYVVTNHHVIADADKIVITLKDGRQFDAKKLGSDAESDIALLQIEADNLTAVNLGNSDKLRVGDFAIAIGNPFGLGQTVTSGIISALGRSGLGIEQYENFIQTDAAINSGNSGGALVNFNGQLIGINTAILGPNGGNVGIGFAIPANMMQNLVEQLLEFGKVKRGVLGITGSNLNAELAENWDLDTTHGAFVGQVFADTAAEKAGLKAGDVIISVDGNKVTSFPELRAKVGTLGAGKVIKLGVIRDGEKLNIDVTLGESEQASLKAAILHPSLEGATFSNGQTNNNEPGILVSELSPRSPAQIVGLKEGDIITGVYRKRVTNIAELRDSLDQVKGPVALHIVRGNTSLYLMIR